MATQKLIEQLFRTHYRAMVRTAHMLLHDEAESKDIVHDVFAAMLCGQTEVRPETTEAFLLTCVRNRCLNALRDREIHERVAGLYVIEQKASLSEQNMQLEAQILRLQDALELVTPPECLEVLMLHFRNRLTFREIAQHQGVSETTVYKRLNAALTQLRTLISKE